MASTLLSIAALRMFRDPPRLTRSTSSWKAGKLEVPDMPKEAVWIMPETPNWDTVELKKD